MSTVKSNNKVMFKPKATALWETTHNYDPPRIHSLILMLRRDYLVHLKSILKSVNTMVGEFAGFI